MKIKTENSIIIGWDIVENMREVSLETKNDYLFQHCINQLNGNINALFTITHDHDEKIHNLKMGKRDNELMFFYTVIILLVVSVLSFQFGAMYSQFREKKDRIKDKMESEVLIPKIETRIAIAERTNAILPPAMGN